MKEKYIDRVEKYFDDEAKRLAPILLDESLLGFNCDKLKKSIDKRISDYYILLEFRLINYCNAIKNNIDLSKCDTDLKIKYKYYNKYYKYKKNEEDLNEIAKQIVLDQNEADDICYVLKEVKEQAQKIMKSHNDSVDYLTIIYLIK